MPELSRFHGVIVRMYFRDHGPPHFHVVYSGDEASVNILDLTILEGWLPPRARRLVLRWASLHRNELLEAWNAARREEPHGRIDPLP